jgi:hypothetical protein
VGKVGRLFAILCTLSVTSCVPEDFQGVEFDVQINSGPAPQLVQPATPTPPLPTDRLHPMSEWPPTKP